jgi:dCTP deaminase
MTILSDHSIKQQIKAGNLVIKPFDNTNVQPSSVDVRLSNVMVYQHELPWNTVIDPFEENENLFSIPVTHGPESWIILPPHTLALASTMEYFEIPNNLIARVEGKSSLGRLGLQVHLTAGFIDPGFKGNVTLELVNTLECHVKLYPGMLIAQIAFEYLDKPTMNSYGSTQTNSKYQNDRGPQTSRYYMNVKPESIRTPITVHELGE